MEQVTYQVNNDVNFALNQAYMFENNQYFMVAFPTNISFGYLEQDTWNALVSNDFKRFYFT